MDGLLAILLVSGIAVSILCCFLFSNFFRSFLNSKVLAICLPTNVLLYAFSFVLQIQNFLCSLLLVVQHVLSFSKSTVFCFGSHLQKIVTVIIFCFYLAISVTGYIEKFYPSLYGSIQPRTMEILSMMIGFLSLMWYLLGNAFLCESWTESCAMNEDCGSPFRTMTLLTIAVAAIIATLMSSKEWMSKVLRRFRPQVHPSTEVDNVDQLDINNSDESKEIVSIAVHTLTFFMVVVFALFSMLVSRLLELRIQDSIVKLIFPLVNTALHPAIWILAKPEMRNHAWRRLKGWLQFGAEM